MTGFGRAEHLHGDLIVRVEISTVNRKQADLQFNLPRGLIEIESTLRPLVLRHLSRGRANINIQLERTEASADQAILDLPRALALENAFVQLAQHLKRPLALEAGDFLRTPGLFAFSDSFPNPDDALAAIVPAMEAALDQLLKMRAAEGADLKADLLTRLDLLASLIDEIQIHAPKVVVRQRESLHARLRDAGLQLDSADERVARELAIFAERCDISEEITRLHSHLARFREYLDASEAAGRSLDFLCQEINRELNTIGSKANDSAIAQNIVTAKTELEKIREQVQNIE